MGDASADNPQLDEGRPSVVIIGGGFAGLNAAKELGKRDVDVYLIDRNNYHLFQPLLYQVATAGLGPEDIASPLRMVLRRQDNVKTVLGEVEDIDRDERIVHFDTGQIAYDFLIVATGMETSYYGNDHWEELAPGLKTMDDALECRRRILKVFERAEWTDDPEMTNSLLTFVIVGAGPTGVEMAGAIREIAHKVMVRDFRNIDASKARVILVDAQSDVLSAYHQELSQRAQRDLEEMGVEVHLDVMVQDITPEGVQIGEEFVDSNTVIWAAGVTASPLGEALDTKLDRMGRVIVDGDLTLPGDDRVFVVGDLAYLEEDGEALPGLAPVAIQQGKHAARNIRRSLGGDAMQPFEYNDKGKMATLGRAKAIAEIGDRRFGGFVAWVLWLFVHLLFLIGFRNRLFVLLNWAYAYVGMRRSARLIMGGPEIPQEDSMPDRALIDVENREQFSVRIGGEADGDYALQQIDGEQTGSAADD